MEEFLKTFADLHVCKVFRTRFVLEALKKPGRLHSRLCHRIEEVFPEKYAEGGLPTFADGDLCIGIATAGSLPDLEIVPWRVFRPHVREGSGLLVASADARQFYCETETEYGSPCRVYSSF